MFKDLRQSFMIHCHRPDEGGISIREIMEVTGIRDYESVRRIVALDPEKVTKKVKGIYNRL